MRGLPLYEFIRGPLIAVGEDYAIIEAGDIGYRLKVPASSVSRISGASGPIQLYTFLRVRDDAMVLYGFATIEEREIFARVCTVAGVGPGIGLNILSGITIDEFRHAVATGQSKVLERVKGVGRKTAQRLVLELKEVLGAEGGSVTIPHGQSHAVAADAVAALLAIGFTPHEADSGVSKALRSHPEADVTEIVRLATQ